MRRARRAASGVGELLAAHRALAAVDAAAARGGLLRAAGGAVLVARRPGGLRRGVRARLRRARRRARATRSSSSGEIERAALPRLGDPGRGRRGAGRGRRSTPVPAAWSEEELLREQGLRALHRRRARDRAAAAGAARPARRRSASRAARCRPARRREVHDLRATIRALAAPRRRAASSAATASPALRARAGSCCVCDVSGSMAPYARMLLHVPAGLRGGARARRGVRVRHAADARDPRAAGRDPDRALGRAAEAVADWSGGTRIGEALAELNRVHGRRIGRGALVVILSDGWDRGEPEQLAEEMARLRRCAHRVVWLNPLAADPRYEPLTRGMQAALPARRPPAPGQLDRLPGGAGRADGGRCAGMTRPPSAARPSRIGGIVLAAGEGKRFGGAQAARRARRAAAARARASRAMLAVPALDPVVVVLGAHADAIRAQVDLGGADVVVCDRWADGQSASLQAGVAALGEVEAAVVTLGDQPFISAEVIAGVLDHRGRPPRRPRDLRRRSPATRCCSSGALLDHVDRARAATPARARCSRAITSTRGRSGGSATRPTSTHPSSLQEVQS